MDCIFCKIISGEIPGEVVYQDDDMMFFHDIDPKAPVHILAVPKKHTSSIAESKPADAEVIGKLIVKLGEYAMSVPELKKGFRIVANSGKEAGQTVFHTHFHLLGGRRLAWPPG